LKFKCYAILEKHKREFSITVKRVSEYRSWCKIRQPTPTYIGVRNPLSHQETKLKCAKKEFLRRNVEIFNEFSILFTDTTARSERWYGWYVPGSHALLKFYYVIIH
jgi:hypothetical protein